MNRFVVLLLLALGTVVYAEESKSYNPADVTEAASHIEIMPEHNRLTDGDANLVRLVYDVDWANGKYSVTGELQLAN